MNNISTKQATIELTKEQKAKMAQDLGIIVDEIVLGEIPDNIDSGALGKLDEDFFIAMGKTYQLS